MRYGIDGGDDEEIDGTGAGDQHEVEEDAGQEDGQDDEAGDDEARASGDEEDEGEEGQVAQRPSGRANNRVQSLRNENKALAERVARQAREFEEFKAQVLQGQARPAAPDPEIERARLAMMTPEERLEERLNQAEARHQQQIQQIQFNTWDQTDRNAFANLQAQQPRVKEVAGEVEKLFAEQVRRGAPIGRDVIAAYVLGKSFLEKGAKSGASAAGADRINRARPKPGATRSNVSAGAERRGKSLEDRLDGVLI